MTKYTTFAYDKKLDSALNDCIKLFLDNYPELKSIPISKNKILYELVKFYLKGSKYYKLHGEVFE